MSNNSDKTERLEGLLSNHVQDAENYIESKIAPNRALAYSYYNGEMPAARKNAPDIVKKVVFEKVQGALPLIKEPFIAGRDVVKFMPYSVKDGAGARIASAVVNKILKVDNNIEKIYDTAILDGLIAKSGTIKAYWEEKEELIEEAFTGLSEDAYEMLISDDSEGEVEVVEVEVIEPDFDIVVLQHLSPWVMSVMVAKYPSGPDELQADMPEQSWEGLKEVLPEAEEEIDEIVEANSTYTGIITRSTDVSTARLKNVAPENFLIDESAISIDTSVFSAERSRVSVSDLVSMGFKQDLIDEVAESGSTNMDDGGVSTARNSFDDTYSDYDRNGDESHCYVDLYECYVETALVDHDTETARSKQSKLYQMYYANNTLLEYNEVDSRPFFTWTPLPVANKMFGMSMAETLFEEQDSATYSLRGALQYLAFSTNPRYKAIEGTEYNLGAFQANLPGSVVPITKGDLIPFEYPRLDQSLFSLLGTIGQQADAVSGVSDLSVGLNSDALRSNVAGSTVATQMDASSRRTKNYARNLATQCIAPAYGYIYELFRKNSKVNITVQIDGQDVDVDPRSLPPRKDVDIDYVLGRNDQIEQGVALMNTKNRIESSPTLAAMQTHEQVYSMETDIMSSFGIYDVTRYITPPTTPKPPTQAEAEQIRLQEQNLALQEQQTQVNAMNAQNRQAELVLEARKMALEEDKFKHSRMVDVNEARLSNDQFEHAQKVDADKANLADEKFEHTQRVDADKANLAEDKVEIDALKAVAEVRLESEQERPVSLD